MHVFRIPVTVMAGALLAAAPALAGYKIALEVVIDDAARSAGGEVGLVFNSADNRQSIGCSSNSSNFGHCLAMNSAGVTRQCSTTDPAFIATIQSIKSDSLVYFNWDSANTCTLVYVFTSSQTRLKR